MIYVVINQEYLGAVEHRFTKHEEIRQFLRSTKYWNDALQKFDSTDWQIGDWMTYPNGWVFFLSEPAL